MKGNDGAGALGTLLLLEKLSSTGECQAGRPENRHCGYFDSASHVSE